MHSTIKKQFRIHKKYKDSLIAHQDLIAGTARLLLQRPVLLERYFEQSLQGQRTMQTVSSLLLSDEELQKIEELKQLILSIKGQTSDRQAMEAIACQIQFIYGEIK